MQQNPKILIIEDEVHLMEGLSLRIEGYTARYGFRSQFCSTVT